jgi:TonB family protein
VPADAIDAPVVHGAGIGHASYRVARHGDRRATRGNRRAASPEIDAGVRHTSAGTAGAATLRASATRSSGNATTAATADRFAAPAQPPQVIAREPAVDLTFDSGTVRDFVSIPGGTGGDATFVEPPPAPTPVPPQPVHPGGKIRAPTRTKNVLPVYPRLAQTVRVEGDVLIEAVIGPDGRVRETRVLRSIPLLDQAALDAVRAWEYTPTFLNDQPVPVILTVTVRFRLN